MKQIIEYVQSYKFWNIVFKIALIVLLLGIFISLHSISESIQRTLHGPEKKEHIMIKEEAKELPKAPKKEEIKKDISIKDIKTNSGEVQVTSQKDTGKETPGFWASFWGNTEASTKTGAKTSSGANAAGPEATLPKADTEKRYNFKCGGGNLLRVYEGKYEIRGQKSTLESGKIALDDPQDGRIHFLTKVEDTLGKAVYDKTVSHFENGKDATFHYVFTTFSNGEATFTKDGKNLYFDCKIQK